MYFIPPYENVFDFESTVRTPRSVPTGFRTVISVLLPNPDAPSASLYAPMPWAPFTVSVYIGVPFTIDRSFTSAPSEGDVCVRSKSMMPPPS